MAKCKECCSESEVGIKDFCSDKCLKTNIQKRINKAVENDDLHTKKLFQR